MKFRLLKTIILAPFVLFAVFYVAMVVIVATREEAIAIAEGPFAPHGEIAIFGASGTAGDGILKAALADPDIALIHVVTRRVTPRIEDGIASGKVRMVLHMDYLDYSAIIGQLADADAVFWAIGTSTVGVDEETYGLIHVEFPAQFVSEWLAVSKKPDISFHYISSSDIAEDSRMMWAREKVRAEKTLFELASGTRLRVIAYRPDYIGPTAEQAHLGQNLLYWFFAPVRSAVRARQIGEAMIEVTARGPQFENGTKVGTWAIIRYSDAYARRRSAIANGK